MKMGKTTNFSVAIVAIVGMWLAYSLLLMGPIFESTLQPKVEYEPASVTDVERVIYEVEVLDQKLEKVAERSELERLEIKLESTKILAHHLGEDWQEHILDQQNGCDFHVRVIKKLKGKAYTEPYHECLMDRRASYIDKHSFDVLILDEIDIFEANLERAIREGWTVHVIHGDLAESLDDIQKEMRNYQRDIDESR